MFPFGSIVLTRFPFTDLSGDKRRPARVVSRDNDRRPDLIVCVITSTPRTGPDMAPLAATAGTGLASVVRFDKLATLDRSVIAVRLGAAPADWLAANWGIFFGVFGLRLAGERHQKRRHPGRFIPGCVGPQRGWAGEGDRHKQQAPFRPESYQGGAQRRPGAAGVNPGAQTMGRGEEWGAGLCGEHPLGLLHLTFLVEVGCDLPLVQVQRVPGRGEDCPTVDDAQRAVHAESKTFEHGGEVPGIDRLSVDRGLAAHRLEPNAVEKGRAQEVRTERLVDALDLLFAMERAWIAARAAVAGRRRNSRAAAAVDLLAAAPLVSATSLAAALGMAVKNAAALLDDFCRADIAIEVTHRSKRRLFGLKGLVPLRDAVRPPDRPDLGRGPGRPRRDVEEELPAAAIAPLPPLTPIERRVFDYSDLDHWMAQMDQAIRQARHALRTLAPSTRTDADLSDAPLDAHLPARSLDIPVDPDHQSQASAPVPG